MDNINPDITILDNSYYSLSKEPKNYGCGKNKCPCRKWTECHKYVDIESQQKRLKLKITKSKTLKDIEEWYSRQFRQDFYIPDLYCSG